MLLCFIIIIIFFFWGYQIYQAHSRQVRGAGLRVGVFPLRPQLQQQTQTVLAAAGVQGAQQKVCSDL
jgi:hypothetical protein